jgi:predicted phosphodiesterase
LATLNWLQRILRRPILWATNRYASRPNRQRIFESLSKLYASIAGGEVDKGPLISFDAPSGKFIIFSDQHKGGRNGADDFVMSETVYLEALQHYHNEGFHFVALGDCEELWENTWMAVKKAHQPSFEQEKKFIQSGTFTKVFGNHDLQWKEDPFAPFFLKEVYGTEVPIYEGVVLQTGVAGKDIRIFCTHGHQGDEVSDGNWFSKFFVSRIWAPLQAFVKINPNTPAYDNGLKTTHNLLMQEWSAAQKGLLLITGHTHQPVFESLTHLERLYRRLLFARKASDQKLSMELEHEIQLRRQAYKSVSDQYLSLQPSYFNTGCCCFSDGDITGIEIADATLRLIKWKKAAGKVHRQVLEETPLADLLQAVITPEESNWM